MGKAKGLKKKKSKLKWTLTLLTLAVRAYSVYLTCISDFNLCYSLDMIKGDLILYTKKCKDQPI
jgi:hypothetical protein